ncbi:MAG: phosphotransferase family protein [Acidimicrobiia bacterium]
MTAAPSPPGLDIERFDDWAARHLPECTPPVTAERIVGGYSNLTYRVTDAAGRSFAVRRPPLHGVLPSAHDMGREHRIISALRGTDVPVPDALAICDDDSVLGAPFYVMGFVDGVVLGASSDVDALSLAARRTVGVSMADTLAALHALDIDAVGLGTLAKREDYVARQLKRWLQQVQHTKTLDTPAIERAHDLLAERVPPQREATIVHGDYRPGNCIVDHDGHVVAVLDWELCTLGDPLADVGYLAICWPEADREQTARWGPNVEPGFISRAELLERYADRSGRDIGDLAFYVGLAYWRLACISEGVLSRTMSGAQGDTRYDAGEGGGRVTLLVELAVEWAAQAPPR